MKQKTLLVFTGGGLAPALNPTLYGVISQAKKEGYKILGGMYGWACLAKNGKIIDLTNINIEPIRDVGGTFLRSSRTNPFSCETGQNELLKKIKELKLDAIVAIGGDDTIGAAYKLHQYSIIPVVGVPKTIDNDLPGTYWSPGYPSAAYYISQFVKEIKEDAAYALSRIFIVETLGSTAGWPVAAAAYGRADVIIPPEINIELKTILNLIEKKYRANGSFAVIATANEAKISGLEGLADNQTDQYSNKRQGFISLPLAKKIKSLLGIETKVAIPSNYVETGQPIKIDRDVAIALGRKAVVLIKTDKFGQMAIVCRPSWDENKITIGSVALAAMEQGKKKMDSSYFDFKNLKVKQKYFNYMEPILGKFETKKDSYLKLLDKIN